MIQLYRQLLSTVKPICQKAILLSAMGLFQLAASSQSLNNKSSQIVNSGEALKKFVSVERKASTHEQRTQIEIQFSSKIIAEKLSIHIPQNWIGKEVVFELYSDSGDKIQKVIEHKSSGIEVLDMNPLAAGSFLVKASCGSEFAIQTIIHTQQL